MGLVHLSVHIVIDRKDWCKASASNAPYRLHRKHPISRGRFPGGKIQQVLDTMHQVLTSLQVAGSAEANACLVLSWLLRIEEMVERHNSVHLGQSCACALCNHICGLFEDKTLLLLDLV